MNKKQKLLSTTFGLLFFVSSPLFASNATISSSFYSAKNKLYKEVYPNSGSTFYAQCEWSKKKINLSSCNLQDAFSKKQIKRASRVEAEHVIPASWFYKKDGAWRTCATEARRLGKKYRKYCQENDIDYRNAHNDLVNLRPSVGQINAHRSNKPFSDKRSGKNVKTYRGNTIMTIDSRVAIPPKSIRGDIARIGFYMEKHYGVGLSKRQRTLFFQWHKQDPVDAEERALNQRIYKAQGTANEFVGHQR